MRSWGSALPGGETPKPLTLLWMATKPYLSRLGDLLASRVEVRKIAVTGRPTLRAGSFIRSAELSVGTMSVIETASAQRPGLNGAP